MYYSKVVLERCYKTENLNKIYLFFEQSDHNLMPHALWLIGNICAEKNEIREFVVSKGFLNRISKILDDFSAPDEVKEKAVWVVCNLTRGNVDKYSYEFLDLINPLKKFLKNSIDENEISNCLFIIYKLTSTTGILLDKFIDKDVYNKLVDLMTYNDTFKYYSLKILANLLSSSDHKAQILIDQGILDVYLRIFEDNDPKIIKEALWGLSNICAGTASQIEKLEKKGIISKVLELTDYLVNNFDQDICFSNVSIKVTYIYTDFERMCILYC
jgi:hypothetical protein